MIQVLDQIAANQIHDVVPDNIYDLIHHEIEKRNIDKYSLDIFSLRKILKDIKLRKYYERVPKCYK